MLKEGAFRDSLVTFSVFAVVIVPLTFVLSLALALLVNKLRFARAFFRSVFFLPTACSYVVASLVWKLSIFNGVRFGLANTVLSWFGVDPIAWLSTTSPPWYWPVIVSARLWLQVGFYMILFLAGLQRIPKELYEAAYVDGASPGWQTLRYITLPQLRTTSVAVLLLNLIAAYQAFDEFYNLLGTSEGYPPFARPPLVYLYFTALGKGQDFGHGSAGAVILALIIAIVTVLQGRFLGFGRKDAG
jgi:multiple sugar transport system permease protein